MVLAAMFAIACIGGSFGGGNMVQINQATAQLIEVTGGESSFFYGRAWLFGALMAAVVAAIILGGIKSIARVTDKVVPFMVGIYIVGALVVIFGNLGEVPSAFGKILDGAFNSDAMYGGLVGVLIQGFKRAAFSNEAGIGSASIAHSAAKTDEPVSEGVVALLEPFIDTVLVCTMTGLVIIIAGGEWIPNPQLTTVKIGDTVLVDGQPALDEEGKEKKYDAKSISDLSLGKWENERYNEYIAADDRAALTRTAVAQNGLPWFKWVLYAAVVLFAFSTIISWSYYGERCFTSLFGMKSSMVYKVIFLIFTVLGSIVSADNILGFSDIMILSMSLPNILGLYILSGKVKGNLDEYMGKLKSGKIKPHK